MKTLIKKSLFVLKHEGLIALIKKVYVYVSFKIQTRHARYENMFKDVLFINGCPIDYCERYRVEHKMEELKAYGLSCDLIEAHEIDERKIKYYRAFVIYRMPYTESFENLVNLIHENNKVVFYDIDDLVFDLKYTKSIKALKKLSKEELANYNDGVIRYGKMMDLCDYSITTTKVIAKEMKSHVKDVCVDKNIASLEMQKFSNIAIKKVKKDKNKVVIGYSSGSTTHNADLDLITPALLKILEKHSNVYLKFIGALSVPDAFKEYENRVLTVPFMNYKKLPSVIRSLDINLAPLEDTFFNSAKSSIKWMEAALVKVPTIASDVGNFHDSITNNKDGILCKDDEWFEALDKLVSSRELREKIANKAYDTVYSKYTAITSGRTVSDFILSKLNKNIFFVIPGVVISGGVIVSIKHAMILKKKGYDVTFVNMDKKTSSKDVIRNKEGYVYVIPSKRTKFESHVDTVISTMWFTLPYAIRHFLSKDFRYLVQSKESGFYEPDAWEILDSNATYYNNETKYITISKWCQEWLKNDFGKDSLYAPNGINLKLYNFRKRTFKGKIKVLIEGDSSSHYKNVDESFRIANKLDKDKFEVNYLSYKGKPKKWYEVDNFYHKVSPDEVGKIYEKNDILIKSSFLESFSYPPLEMMATGGIAIACPNEGNMEYLKDGENCMLYERGDIDAAVQKINEVCNNKELREKLIKGGLETAKSRDWNNIEKEILKLYE